MTIVDSPLDISHFHFVISGSFRLFLLLHSLGLEAGPLLYKSPLLQCKICFKKLPLLLNLGISRGRLISSPKVTFLVFFAIVQ